MQAERITEEYRKLNQQLHEERDDYGRSGQLYAQAVLQLAMVTGSQNSILDYGCGKQTLANALPQLTITGYDPCIPGLDSLPEPHDLVVCTDVLEHIEPDLLEGVLQHLHDLTRKVIFLTIATRPAKKTLPDGRNAHLIIEDYRWWLDKVFEYFDIQTFQNVEDKTLIITGTPL